MTKSLVFSSFLLWGISALFFIGCSNSSDYSGQEPRVSAADAVVVFQAGAEEDVTFLHQKHAEFWGQACFVCHNHFDVRTDGAWKCTECHSNNDTEGLCVDDANNHDCMAAQCYACHQDPAMVPGGDPAPNCIDCHIPISTGTFIDGPVQGLRYQTSSQSGLTDASGSFFYLAGDDITFSVGTIVIGSAPVRGFMTPLDLVVGAAGVTDQTVTNIARFLQSLDVDGNPDNGTVLPPDIHTVAQGMTINFAADKATFELNQNLIALLNNYVYTLVDEADAQAHLKNSIDTQFPPVVTSIGGAPNTHFILQGLYNATAGVNYTYKWYQDCPVGGVAEIGGVTTTAYQPTAGDVGCNILFEVTPDNGGLASQSSWTLPITDAKTVTVVSTIDSPSQVDQFHFRLGAGSTDAVFEVNSYEPDASGGMTVPHDFFGNGNNNDYLISNIYLFQANGTPIFGRFGVNPYFDHLHYVDPLTSLWPDRANGWTPYYEWIDKWGGRAKKNPIVNVTGMAAGDYVFALGVNNLSEADALSGQNSDGNSWYNVRTDYSVTPNVPIPNQKHYQLIITFTY